MLTLVLGVLLAAASAFAEPSARFEDVEASESQAPKTPPPGSLREAPLHRVPQTSSPSTCPGAEHRLVRARRWLDERRALLAMGELSRAISEDARCGPAYVLLARLRSSLGDFGEAELLLAHAVRLPQVADQALRERSLMRRRQGRTSEALRDLETYVGLAPDDPGRLETLATVYIELKAWPAALATYRRMLSLYEGSLQSEPLAQTRIKVRALSLLAADADPVVAGDRTDRSWERRAMAQFSDR